MGDEETGIVRERQVQLLPGHEKLVVAVPVHRVADLAEHLRAVQPTPTALQRLASSSRPICCALGFAFS